MANLHLVCSSGGSAVNAPAAVAVQCRLDTAYKQAIAFDYGKSGTDEQQYLARAGSCRSWRVNLRIEK